MERTTVRVAVFGVFSAEKFSPRAFGDALCDVAPRTPGFSNVWPLLEVTLAGKQGGSIHWASFNARFAVEKTKTVNMHCDVYCVHLSLALDSEMMHEQYNQAQVAVFLYHQNDLRSWHYVQQLVANAFTGVYQPQKRLIVALLATLNEAVAVKPASARAFAASYGMDYTHVVLENDINRSVVLNHIVSGILRPASLEHDGNAPS